MRFLFALITIYAAIVFFGGVLSAKENDAPITIQTKGWDIIGLSGAQEVSQKPENCLMQTQYDNGLQVTFKATGKKMTALRVQSMHGGINLNDFKGFVGLGVGKNSYALQSKTIDGRIDATLLTVPNLAEKLKKATVFRLKLGTDNTYFALQGFDDAYHRLLVCMGVMPTKTLPVVNHAKGMPRPPVAQPKIDGETVMPSEPVEVVQATTLGETLLPIEGVDEDANVTKVDAQVKMPTPITPASAINTPEKSNSAVIDDVKDAKDDKAPQLSEKQVAEDEKKADLPKWRAFKGQKLSSVLIAWADQQGVETHIAMDQNPVLSKDIVLNGSFEMAVNALLKQTGVGNAASAIVKNNDGRVTHVAGYQGEAMINRDITPQSNKARWRALQGTDLRKVLMQWSAKEGVDFVWDAPEVYLVRESVKAVTTYEDAVSLILNQYNGQPTRPVAQLNKDPDTGRVSLIIKTKRS